MLNSTTLPGVDSWTCLLGVQQDSEGQTAPFTEVWRHLLSVSANRTNKMDHSMSIHVSLSGALFLLNSTFLLTEWGANVELSWVCESVAALMHYSLLCCFTWMAIEALHLYLLLIKVFNTHFKYYLLKLSVVGWGKC